MNWYEEEVQKLEHKHLDDKNNHGLVFYGSSSIRLWETLGDDFHGYNPINLGFGGSTLAACGWFFERLFAHLSPSGVIVYAGDNDLGDSRHPEEIYIFFKELFMLLRSRYPDLPLCYISVKPSIKRLNLIGQIRYTNKIIEDEIKKMGDNIHYIDIFDKMLDEHANPRKDLFDGDGLHLTHKGYEIWKDAIYTSGFLNKLKPH